TSFFHQTTPIRTLPRPPRGRVGLRKRGPQKSLHASWPSVLLAVGSIHSQQRAQQGSQQGLQGGLSGGVAETRSTKGNRTIDRPECGVRLRVPGRSTTTGPASKPAAIPLSESAIV